MGDRVAVGVVTATYNRQVLLEDLYRSLCGQSSLDFEWIVVDDGSTDGTRDLVLRWKRESPFFIDYIFRENGGKQAAINCGVERSSAPLIAIVDSDDLLLEDAIERVAALWRIYREERALMGIFAAMQRGRVSVSSVVHARVAEIVKPKDQFNVRKVEDFLPIIRRDLLVGLQFPVCQGEKFISEGIVWNRLSRSYRSLFMFVPLAVCRYQKDGLSARSIRLRVDNVKGSLLYYSEADDPVFGAWNRWRARINFNRFYFHALKSGVRERPRGSFTRVAGWLLYLRDCVRMQSGHS